MSEPLLLIDQLLAKVRQLEQLGCRQEAQRMLLRLVGFRTLAPAAAVEARTRLGRLFLRQRRFGAARNHLTAALALQPRHARIHALLARATNARGQGNLERATDHARRAAELAPNRPNYAVVYGTLLLRQGHTEQGLTCLREALTAAPDDVGILTRVVRGLCRAEQWQEARQAVQTALFRQPRCADLVKLSRDVNFQELRSQQQRHRLQRAARFAEQDGPTLLPFVRPQLGRVAGKTFRLDGAATLPGPHFPRSLRLSDSQQA